jgi:cytochrome c oxidase subunit III
MTVRSSRFTRPIAPGTEDARTIGWWGMVLGIIALAHLVGAFIVSYLYLRAGQPEWPPAGVEPPDLLLPALAPVLTAAAAILATLEVRWTERRAILGMVGATGAILVGLGAILARVLVLTGVDFLWDEHAYGSVYWLLNATDITLVASGVIGSAVLLAQHAMGDYDERRTDEIRVLSLYWWFAVAASVALYLTVNLVPYM